jgi:hypothetical protein
LKKIVTSKIDVFSEETQEIVLKEFQLIMNANEQTENP